MLIHTIPRDYLRYIRPDHWALNTDSVSVEFIWGDHVSIPTRITLEHALGVRVQRELPPREVIRYSTQSLDTIIATALAELVYELDRAMTDDARNDEQANAPTVNETPREGRRGMIDFVTHAPMPTPTGRALPEDFARNIRRHLHNTDFYTTTTTAAPVITNPAAVTAGRVTADIGGPAMDYEPDREVILDDGPTESYEAGNTGYNYPKESSVAGDNRYNSTLEEELIPLTRDSVINSTLKAVRLTKLLEQHLLQSIARGVEPDFASVSNHYDELLLTVEESCFRD